MKSGPIVVAFVSIATDLQGLCLTVPLQSGFLQAWFKSHVPLSILCCKGETRETKAWPCSGLWKFHLCSLDITCEWGVYKFPISSAAHRTYEKWSLKPIEQKLKISPARSQLELIKANFRPQDTNHILQLFLAFDPFLLCFYLMYTKKTEE